MATTAIPIVPRKSKRALSKAHRAKLVSALAKWRASLSEEERAELSARTAATHRARWDNMTEKERKARLAGVKAWQAQQRAAKRAAAKATPKAPVMASATKAPSKGSRAVSVGSTSARQGAVKRAAGSKSPGLETDPQWTEVKGPDGTSKPSTKNNVLANRKAAAK